MDVLSIGAFANFACLLQLAGEARTDRERAWVRAAGAGWLGLLAFGLGPLTAHNFNVDLPFMRACNAAGGRQRRRPGRASRSGTDPGQRTPSITNVRTPN